MNTRSIFLFLLVGLMACGDDDTPTPDAGALDGGVADSTVDSSSPDSSTLPLGDLTVVLEAEDTITEGIGTEGGDEIILDGWSVAFDRYIVAIGDVDVHLATDESIEAEASDVFVVDLTDVPESGLPLWSLDGLQAGRWQFNYSTPGAGDGSTRHESVTQADYDAMVAADWTYLISATMSNASGQSCPPATLAVPGDATPNGNVNSRDEACYDAPEITFTWGVTAETVFGPCEIDEMPGFAIPEGGSQTVAATIHGDHIFFNGFPEGEEGGTERYAQWVADSDLNLDGEVTREELEQIAPSDLAEIDERYALGGSPIPLTEMWDYLTGQLKTQGHFQGEGECPFDGMAHEHDD